MKAAMDKNRRRPTLRILLKYSLLQLPGVITFALILILLRHWIDFPGYLAWTLLGVWVAKDIILFPSLWRFYDPSLHPDRFRMVGRKGIAVTRLNPDGYVLVQGERWQAGIAAGLAPIGQGDTICVEAIKGLKLTVRPCAEGLRLLPQSGGPQTSCLKGSDAVRKCNESEISRRNRKSAADGNDQKLDDRNLTRTSRNQKE
jgi:membrane protein implicated in regulation of membrane protease activity